MKICLGAAGYLPLSDEDQILSIDVDIDTRRKQVMVVSGSATATSLENTVVPSLMAITVLFLQKTVVTVTPLTTITVIFLEKLFR